MAKKKVVKQAEPQFPWAKGKPVFVPVTDKKKKKKKGAK